MNCLSSGEVFAVLSYFATGGASSAPDKSLPGELLMYSSLESTLDPHSDPALLTCISMNFLIILC